MTVSTAGETVRAFVPNPLPPRPPIEWTPALRSAFDEAHLALGRLDSVSTLLPDTGLFLYMYVRKEAVLSSMIEGTQSSLSDLLLYELDEEPGVPADDVREVSNYVAALDHGTARQAAQTAAELHARAARDRDAIDGLGRAAASALGVHRALLQHPIATSNWLVGATGLTPATVNKSLVRLEELGIVRELTARRRNRIFSYASYVEIMNRGTELPAE
jgi:Fic family protein